MRKTQTVFNNIITKGFNPLLFIAFVLLFFAGCNSDSEKEEIKNCNNLCKETEICENNVCVTKQTECTTNNDCINSVCRNNVCTEVPCMDDQYCKDETEYCDYTSGKCLAKKYCITNSDCDNSVCRSNICTQISCTDNQHSKYETEICSLNQICVNRKSCTTNTDCSENMKCEGNYCLNQTECYNSFCNVVSSESCVENVCAVPDLCVGFDCSEFTNVHCEAKNNKADCFCNPGYMINEDITGCIEIPACTDDDVANDIVSGKIITKPYNKNHHICPEKSDYFHIYLQNGETVNIKLTIQNGDVDIYLHSNMTLSGSVVASSVTEEFIETITYTATQSQYYYLRVVPYYTTDIDYLLEVE